MANYLDYSKKILTSMSFCSKLLRKEYQKSSKYLTKIDKERFKSWLRTQEFASKLGLRYKREF